MDENRITGKYYLFFFFKSVYKMVGGLLARLVKLNGMPSNPRVWCFDNFVYFKFFFFGLINHFFNVFKNYTKLSFIFKIKRLGINNIKELFELEKH